MTHIDPSHRGNCFDEALQRAIRAQPGTSSQDADVPPQDAERRIVPTRHTKAAIRVLKMLAAAEDSSIQALVNEGLNRVLDHRGYPPIF